MKKVNEILFKLSRNKLAQLCLEKEKWIKLFKIRKTMSRLKIWKKLKKCLN